MKARVLLVEDDEINQEVALALLSDTGLVVDVAGNGREAVERVRQSDYALILMDIDARDGWPGGHRAHSGHA